MNEIAKILKYCRDEPHRLGWFLGYDKLSGIHTEWIKYIFDSQKTVVLQAHRNAYKTTAMVVGVIRHLIFYPDQTILIMRKSSTDAEKIVQEIQQHYEREPLRAIYHHLGIDEPRGEKWKMDMFSLSTKKSVTKEANVECLGIDSALTGAHYDKIVLDDIITIDDRISKAVREKTKIRLAEMVNIPKRPHGTISVTGTPWHPQDGYSVLPKAKAYSIYDIDPPILTKSQIDDIKSAMPPSLFAANYELRHISDQDRLFTEPKFLDWDFRYDAIGWVDTGFGGGNNTTFTIEINLGNYYTVIGWSWPDSVIHLYGEFVKLGKKFNVGTITFESNADKGASAREFRKFWPSVEDHTERENKHNKIVNHAVYNWGKIYIANEITEYEAGKRWLSNLLDYQEGQEPDDEADGLASLIRSIEDSGPIAYNLGNLG